MNYYINKTDFGTFIKEQYPQLFDRNWKKKLYKHSLDAFRLIVDS